MTTVYYTPTKAMLDNIFVQTGKRPFVSKLSITIIDELLTPEDRATILRARNALGGFGGFTLETYHIEPPMRTAYGVNAAKIGRIPLEFDQEPTVADCLERLDRMATDFYGAKARIERLQPEYDRLMAEYRAEMEQKRAKAERRQQEAKEQAKQERQARTIIPWQDDKAIVNLYEAVFAASKLDGDTRFNNWIKLVTGVDRARQNGYCFEGEFVRNQTVEIQKGKRVFLVAATTGSRKHQTTAYHVVVMDETGMLHGTDIETDNSDAGWALRIRDKVAELL